MKVSVITVCYNSIETLEDTIRSVISQTHTDVEHIIIDGGSTDGTKALVEKYAGNVAYFVSEPDKGLYDAMNKGLAAATGDVVGKLNSDDFFAHSEVIANIVKCFEGDVDAVYGDVAFFNSNDLNKVVRYYCSKSFHPSKLARGIMPAHPTLYVKRRYFDAVGGYDIQYKIAADFDMCVRLFSLPNFKYVYLPEVFVKMRLGGVSTSGLKSKLLLIKEDVHSCRKAGIKTNWLMMLSKYPRKILGFIIKSK